MCQLPGQRTSALGDSHNLISSEWVRRAPLTGLDKNCFRFTARIGTMGWNDKWLCKAEWIHQWLSAFLWWTSNACSVWVLIMFTNSLYALWKLIKLSLPEGRVFVCLHLSIQQALGPLQQALQFPELPTPAEFGCSALCVRYTHTHCELGCLWAPFHRLSLCGCSLLSASCMPSKTAYSAIAV